MAGNASRQNGKKGGRPKGSRSTETLDKMAAREFVRQRVTAALEALLDAQIANAKGFSVLVSRDAKTGKFTPVEAESQLKDATEIWLVKPNVQAFSDLLNRALDKPAEQIKVTGEDGGPVEHVFRWQVNEP